jgi:predicted AAA+ superfamily ATPase
MLKGSYNKKQYTFPSGNVINYQGYENFAFDELLNIEKINETDIIVNRKEVPEIWYNDKNGKKHRHYVDFYIKSQNRCIEVKSAWTNQDKNNVFEKQTAAIDLGYKYDIWIFDNKGNKINSY